MVKLKVGLLNFNNICVGVISIGYEPCMLDHPLTNTLLSTHLFTPTSSNNSHTCPSDLTTYISGSHTCPYH